MFWFGLVTHSSRCGLLIFRRLRRLDARLRPGCLTASCPQLRPTLQGRSEPVTYTIVKVARIERDVRNIEDGLGSINFGPQSINRGQPSINFGPQSINDGFPNINGEAQSMNRGLPNINGEAPEENRGVRSIRRGAQIINGVVPTSTNLATWMRFLTRLLPQAGPY